MHILLFFVLLQSLQIAPSFAAFDKSDGNLTKGIIFHEDKKILVAEKFMNIQFLLPFPQFDAHIKDELKNITNELQSMWELPTYFCYLNFTNLTMEHFQVNWIVNEVQKEIDVAEIELEKLQIEIQSLLPPLTQPMQDNRTARAIPLAVGALGAIGLFGAGVAMGSGDCGLKGIFGKCQSETNREDINRLFQSQTAILDNVDQIRKITNEKFQVVSKELKTIYDIQSQMTEIQNANWQVISDQLEKFRKDIHDMRNCDQLLYTRQQINFNFDTISSLLSLYYSSIKAYRAAFFAYRMNLLNSVPALLDHYVPMSLLTRDSLERVLAKVGQHQFEYNDRLTLAIPYDEVMSYYDAKLLHDVATLKNGLFITMSIPLASKQTVMTTYQAIPIPMPQNDEDIALLWDIEAEYLAVSEDLRETALLSHRDLEQCIGSSKYSICHQGISTEGVESSCLSQLFFGNLIQAMTVCNVKPFQLPTPERAINLRYGIWLIVSASPNFQIRKSQMESRKPTDSISMKGCRICIVTLECGEQINGPNVNIRSDLSSCALLPATTIDVYLPDQLASILGTLPPVNELPYYNTKAEASIALIKSVKPEIKTLERAEINNEKLHELAIPIVQNMVEMKPPFMREINNASAVTTTLIIGVCSFVISLILHIILMIIIHRCKRLHRFKPFSFFDPQSNQKIRLKPLFTTNRDHMIDIPNHPRNPWKNKCVVVDPRTFGLEQHSNTPTSPSYEIDDELYSSPTCRI